MTSTTEILANLRRPRLLIRAARHGLADYRRDRDLTRLIWTTKTPTPRRALDALLASEAALEETRRSGEATYSVTRHVDILIALIAEARLLPASVDPQTVEP